MTSLARIYATASAAALVLAGSAHAQQGNPLVGTWRGVLKSADNVQLPFQFTYYPNGTWFQTMAIPPTHGGSGSGSGTIASSGTYRMLSDHSVELNNLQRQMCPAGNPGCTAVPPGGRQTILFRFEGYDKVVNTEDGTVTYRVR